MTPRTDILTASSQPDHWETHAMTKTDMFNKLTSQVASASTRGYALVRQQVSDAAASTLDVGDAVRQKVSAAMEHIDVDAAVGQVKELTHGAGAQVQQLSQHVTDLVRKVDRNHKEVAEGIETVSMGLGITAGVAAAGATLAAPSGLGAAAVALGLTSAPLIVTAAPVIAAAATTAGVVSGGAYFYSKWRSRNDVPADDPGMTSQGDAASGADPEPHSQEGRMCVITRERGRELGCRPPDDADDATTQVRHGCRTG